MLGSLIKADTVTSAAQSSLNGTTTTGSTTGTSFTNLSVLGVPVAADVAANTTLALPGTGTVTVNEQTTTPAGLVRVTGLDITVTVGNLLGLPVSTEIRLATANALARHI